MSLFENLPLKRIHYEKKYIYKDMRDQLTLLSPRGHIVPLPTINLFATPRVFVRFSPNLVTFPKILLQII